jgi:hypothetical protein
MFRHFAFVINNLLVREKAARTFRIVVKDLGERYANLRRWGELTAAQEIKFGSNSKNGLFPFTSKRRKKKWHEKKDFTKNSRYILNR